jgi:hypothetical protein
MARPKSKQAEDRSLRAEVKALREEVAAAHRATEFMRRKAEKAEALAAQLEAALREAREILCLSDPEGIRAARITAPEDAAVLALCEATGFGAVMDSAARQWRRRDSTGAYTTGAAVGSLLWVLEKIDAALAPSAETPKPDGGGA